MEALFEPAASQPVVTVEPPPARFNFAAHLFALNAPRAAKTAYIDDSGHMTYGELEDRARRFSSALRGLGVHPEERVLLVMLDTVSLPIAFLGALYAGVVPVVANTLLTPADYVYMLFDRIRVGLQHGAPVVDRACRTRRHASHAAVADIRLHDVVVVVVRDRVDRTGLFAGVAANADFRIDQMLPENLDRHWAVHDFLHHVVLHGRAAPG